jgi:uncharacterized protein YcnI
MKKIVVIFVSVILTFFLTSPLAFAHVVVKPAQVGIGAFQTFTVGVPNEKDNPIVGLRLVIPEGVQQVTPNEKPGWTITMKKTGDGENTKVTEITWTGGSVAAGLRDDFLFSVQVPSKETQLVWKAYQTYENGEVISWDQTPTKEEKDDDSAMKGPYSQTEIIDDLKTSKKEVPSNNNALQLSIIALALAAVSLALQLRKKV